MPKHYKSCFKYANTCADLLHIELHYAFTLSRTNMCIALACTCRTSLCLHTYVPLC